MKNTMNDNANSTTKNNRKGFLKNRKNRIILYLCILVMGLIGGIVSLSTGGQAAQQAGQKGIVGTWKLKDISGVTGSERTDMLKELEAGGVAQFVFKEDTFTSNIQITGMHQRQSGTYSFDGKKLYMTVNGVGDTSVACVLEGNTLKINTNDGVWLILARQ